MISNNNEVANVVLLQQRIHQGMVLLKGTLPLPQGDSSDLQLSTLSTPPTNSVDF